MSSRRRPAERFSACFAAAGIFGLATAPPSAAGGPPDLLWIAGGHNREVMALSVSPDGSRLLSASHDRTLKIWDTQGSRFLRTITLPFVQNAQVVQIPAASYSPDGQIVAASIREADALSPTSFWAHVRLFDAESGAQLHLFPQTAIVSRGLAFSPNGDLLAEGGDDVRIWEVASHGLVTTLATPHEVTSLAFSADGTLLAAALTSGRIRVWSTSDWAPQETWLAHSGQARSIAFDPQQSRLASGGDDGAISLWTAAGELIRSMPHGAAVHAVEFSPSGAQLASGGANGQIKLWNPDDGQLLYALLTDSGTIFSLAFELQSDILLSGGNYPDYSIRRWDSTLGVSLTPLSGHAGPVSEAVFTPDGQQLISAGSYDQTLRRWDADSGAREGVDTIPMTSILDVALSPDGTLEALPTDQNWSVVIRNTSDGSIVETLYGQFAPVDSLEFSPDGAILAVGHDYYGGTVELFSVPDFEFLRQFGEGEGPIYGLVFSPDSSLLATSNGGILNVFRVADGALISEAPYVPTTNCAFSPDNAMLAVASIFSLNTTVVNVSDWSVAATLPARSTDVEFSPEGQYLLAAEAVELQFWRVADWSLQVSYDSELGHGNPFEGVQAVRFSPDGCLFAYGRHDATLGMARNPVAVLRGDTNGDLQVDIFDLAFALSNFGAASGATLSDGDLDGDGDVDIEDLSALLAAYGRVCP